MRSPTTSPTKNTISPFKVIYVSKSNPRKWQKLFLLISKNLQFSMLFVLNKID